MPATSVDSAFRFTLETIWNDFVTGGGFRHDRAWHAYGPYLTLQLAHAFLFTGQLERMDACLSWAMAGGPYDAAAVAAMKTWRANGVRIALNEDCWLGINGAPAQWSGTSYQQFVKSYVEHSSPTVALRADADVRGRERRHAALRPLGRQARR